MTCMTKSLNKHMACETFFAGYHLSDTRPPDSPSELAATGTDFHAYRAALVDRLLDSGESTDTGFPALWLSKHGVSDDAAQLIKYDSVVINPDDVMAQELFLSVKEDWAPGIYDLGSEPGRRAEGDYASGTIDLLLHPSDGVYVIRDVKTGYSGEIDEYEGQHYCALVFAHFPDAVEIRFVWEFIRHRAEKSVTYYKTDEPRLRAAVASRHEIKADIQSRLAAGETLGANPTTGLCVYCFLECPLRGVAIKPLRNDNDVKELAHSVKATESYLEQARSALRAALAERGSVDGVRLDTTASESFSVRRALSVLGVEIPETSPHFDVPLDRLEVKTSRLKSYAKAKMRDGLTEQLSAVAERTPRTTLVLD